MSFPRYPAYKDSGVEWLGEVPEHWGLTALKHGYEVTLGKMLQPEAASEDDILLPYLRAANIHWSGVDHSDIKTMWFSIRDREHLLLQVGDLLVSEGGDVGRSALWQGEISECYFQNSVNRVRPSNGNLTSFLCYWISTMKDKGFIDVLCNKSTIAHFTAEKVGAVPVPIPPVYEQQAIAHFLSHETAKIDALIAEQQRLIELLQEKRQTVISHAVTKGLNPDAPMKDSGLEWLGKVPEHWSMKKINHLCISIEQGWSPQCENEPSEGEAPGILKVGCVNGGLFRPTENKKLPPELAPVPKYSVKRGDLLVSRANTKELVGSVAVVGEDFPWLYICDKLYRITIKPERSSSNYLALYLASREARGQTELGASGASPSMQNISQSVLLDMPIPLPQLDEQELICYAIAFKCSQIDELTAKALEAICLFKERRSAMISAAVTGQIDLRGLVPEEAAA